MTITILFKSGKEIDVECDEFAVGRGLNSELNSYEILGARNGRPIYMDMSEVACIYRKDLGSDGEVRMDEDTPFCPNCGADMRKEQPNDSN